VMDLIVPMRTGLVRWLALLYIVASLGQHARAQTSGTARGQVSDPSGAVIPGATIQFSGNGVTQSAKTDGQGRYRVTVPAGKYEVQANASGFVGFERPDFNVPA